MNSLYAQRIMFVLGTCLFVHNAVGMNFVKQYLRAMCGSWCVPSQHASFNSVSSEQESTLASMPVHNPHDVRRLLYELLDPMPMDLINIIMETKFNTFKTMIYEKKFYLLNYHSYRYSFFYILH